MSLASSRSIPTVDPRPSSVRIESISYPGLGDEIPRVGRIRLELLAQLTEEDAQVLRLLLRGLSPYRLQQNSMRDDAVRVAREVDEQIELLRRQPHLIAVDMDPSSLQVDAEVADVERRQIRGAAGRAAERRAHPRQQPVDP